MLSTWQKATALWDDEDGISELASFTLVVVYKPGLQAQRPLFFSTFPLICPYLLIQTLIDKQEGGTTHATHSTYLLRRKFQLSLVHTWSVVKSKNNMNTYVTGIHLELGQSGQWPGWKFLTRSDMTRLRFIRFFFWVYWTNSVKLTP